VEECRRLDVRELVRMAGYLWHARTVDWDDGYSIGCELELKEEVGRGYLVLRGEVNGKQVIDRVPLTVTWPHYGGLRWWASCPSCSRRVALLYLVPGGRHFRCRQCQDLGYESQLEAPVFRATRRVDRLRRRLGAEPGCWGPVPMRPPRRWRESWFRQLAELRSAEAAVDLAISAWVQQLEGAT